MDNLKSWWWGEESIFWKKINYNFLVIQWTFKEFKLTLIKVVTVGKCIVWIGSMTWMGWFEYFAECWMNRLFICTSLFIFNLHMNDMEW